MKALVEALKDDFNQRREAAVTTYRELLHRGGEAEFSKGDMQRFKEAAGLLGKDMEQVAADYKAVENARELKAVADTVPEAAKAHEAAIEAVREYEAEMGRVQQQLRQRHAQLVDAQNDASRRWQNANRALEQFKALKSNRAAVLVGIEVDVPPEPPLEHGGPFEVTCHGSPVTGMRSGFTGEAHGFRWVNGVGRTTVVSWARQLSKFEGYTVRDLSKEPKQAPAAESQPGGEQQPGQAEPRPQAPVQTALHNGTPARPVSKAALRPPE